MNLYSMLTSMLEERLTHLAKPGGQLHMPNMSPTHMLLFMNSTSEEVEEIVKQAMEEVLAEWANWNKEKD